MSEVACVFGPVVDEVQSRGVPPEKLVEGLGFDAGELGNPRRRIPWEAFTELARRTEEVLGDDGFGAVAARSAEESLPGVIRRALHRFGDARPIYWVGARWWGPWIFRATRAHCEQIADGRLRQVIEILPEYQESPEFFRGVQALLRVMPHLFGLPEAIVELRHDGRRGEFLITPPPARRSAWGRRKRVSLGALPEELFELGFQQEQLRESERRVHAADLLLADQRRRLEAIEALAQRLVEARDARSLLASVLELLEGEFLLRGLRISREAPGEAAALEDLRAETGDVSGTPSSSLRLRAAGVSIGRLELWTFGDEGLSPADAHHAAEIAPWIGLALGNIRAAESEARRLAEPAPPLPEHRLRDDRLREDRVRDPMDWELVRGGLEEFLPLGALSLVGGEPATSLPALGPELAARIDSETVLLMEDDGALRRLVGALFEQAGFEVLESHSDPSALRPEQVQGALLITDWSRAFDAEFMRQIRPLQAELRGMLLLPLRHL